MVVLQRIPKGRNEGRQGVISYYVAPLENGRNTPGDGPEERAKIPGDSRYHKWSQNRENKAKSLGWHPRYPGSSFLSSVLPSHLSSVLPSFTPSFLPSPGVPHLSFSKNNGPWWLLSDTLYLELAILTNRASQSPTRLFSRTRKDEKRIRYRLPFFPSCFLSLNDKKGMKSKGCI